MYFSLRSALVIFGLLPTVGFVFFVMVEKQNVLNMMLVDRETKNVRNGILKKEETNGVQMWSVLRFWSHNNTAKFDRDEGTQQHGRKLLHPK